MSHFRRNDLRPRVGVSVRSIRASDILLAGAEASIAFNIRKLSTGDCRPH